VGRGSFTGVGGDRLAPALIDGSGWVSASASVNHSCASRADLTGRCWGQNSVGELGDGTTTTRYQPTIAVLTAPLTGLTAGSDFGCGRTLDGGNPVCWGRNGNGQLGNGATSSSPGATPAPVVFDGGTADWTALSAGTTHVCGIVAGTLWCWGGNSYGQLGVGNKNNRTVPTRVGFLSDWVSVSAGNYASCAIRANGWLYCWGSNYNGACGLGAIVEALTPSRVGSDSDWSFVSTQSNTSCGVRTDGSLWCWGMGELGQFGDGLAWSAVPVPVLRP
jgi:alpha-tubulin suppressor-like RCC1 family protein